MLTKAAGPASPLPDVTREFVTLKAHDGVDLYAQLVKPADFDPAQKYPVVVHWYGGPGLQMVSNRYGATNIFNNIERDVLYTQAGYLVWRLDNRGSFGPGARVRGADLRPARPARRWTTSWRVSSTCVRYPTSMHVAHRDGRQVVRRLHDAVRA